MNIKNCVSHCDITRVCFDTRHYMRDCMMNHMLLLHNQYVSVILLIEYAVSNQIDTIVSIDRPFYYAIVKSASTHVQTEPRDIVTLFSGYVIEPDY